MEDQIVQDIRLLQVILQENAAQGRIGDDILLDLLLGQNDVNRRVDVVVSQLEDILGQKLFRYRQSTHLTESSDLFSLGSECILHQPRPR